MSKIISVINQKGGVGKTTTCINLAVSLQKFGHKVLAVDLDSQANLTMGMGYSIPDEINITLADLLQAEIGKRTSGKASMPDRSEYMLSAHDVDFIPSCLELAGVELMLVNTTARETVLKTFLEQFKADYDYILIDCLPSLGIFTVNALTASDEIIIPIQPQYFGAKGAEALLQSVSAVRTHLNPSLTVLGILITMLDNRSGFQKQVRALVQDIFSEDLNIFKTCIPLSVEVSKRQSQGVPIVALKNNSVSLAYRMLALELVFNRISANNYCI